MHILLDSIPLCSAPFQAILRLINNNSGKLKTKYFTTEFRQKMYDICHPSYYELCKLSCNDPIKTSTAFYVYIELCEVKRFYDVKYKYESGLDLFYLEVRKSQRSSLEIYIPWASKYSISLDRIEKIQQALGHERLTFVFRSEDSSSVYYTVNTGLLKPAAPEVTKQLKEKEEKRSNLEMEIRRNTSNLYELAKTLAHESTQNCTSDRKL